MLGRLLVVGVVGGVLPVGGCVRLLRPVVHQVAGDALRHVVVPLQPHVVLEHLEGRIFMNYSPTLRTPKGGGHIPSVLKKNGEISSLTAEKAEMLMGFPTGWTDCDAVVMR